jgi:isopenicillin-N N-acyltransferase-like protein
MLSAIRTLILLMLVLGIENAFCHGKPQSYYVNNETIWTGQPKLLRSHPHGKLYEIGEGTSTMKLLHVYGNMYEMGFAHGSLLQDELQSFIGELWEYLEESVEGALPQKIPAFLKKGTSNFAIGAALDLTYELTRFFTNKHYYDEMNGIADASGVPYRYFRRMHMIGELTKGACSMFGAWGTATPDAGTVQLRALDWV